MNIVKATLGVVFVACIALLGHSIYQEIRPTTPCGVELFDSGITCTTSRGHSGPHVNKKGYIWQQESCTAKFMETDTKCSMSMGHKGNHHSKDGLDWLQEVPGTVQNVRFTN